MSPVRQLRSQIGITQKMLAEAAGTSQPTIAAYEAGNKSPTIETLRNLAKSIGVEAVVSFVPKLTREDLRSLAYHRALVEKLKVNPDHVLGKARKNLKAMSKKNRGAERLFRLWREWLELPTSDLIDCCLAPSILARDMRQVTPFAGVLTAGERCKIISEFRRENDV